MAAPTIPFDCTGNTEVMRHGAGVLPSRLGHLDRHRRGRGRHGDRHAAVPARHRAQLAGTAFGGAKGRTDVPKIVDWYMDGKIEIDPMITHVLSWTRSTRASNLMHAGREHPVGGGLLTVETVSSAKAFGGTQGVYRHRRDATGTDMTFCRLRAAARGRRAGCRWSGICPGLTCTHANVTDKGEYRARLRRDRADLRRARHEPAGRGRAGRSRPMTSGRAPASTSTRPQAPWARALPDVELCDAGTAGAGRAAFPGRSSRARRSPATRWAGMAR